MWKPIVKVIDKLYDRYGDKPQPIEPYKLIIDKTQLKHYKVCERYSRLEYEHISDDAYFEDYVKDRLIDKLADVIGVTKIIDDAYRNGDVAYEAEIWVADR